jgi:hypothetical protein
MESNADWKLKLRYGKTVTPYQHFSLIGGGMMLDESNKYGCPLGSAVMSIKIWAEDEDHAADTFQMIGEKVGFAVDQAIEIYKTEPEEPPIDKAYGYDINFIPYD